jgi:hypothetical protein
MAKKIKIKYKGVEYQLRETALRKTTYGGAPIAPYIYIGMVEAGSMVKQYVKNNYPKLKVWVKSDGGTIYSSARVNIANRDGSKVSMQIENDIKVFADSLRSGTFNGMVDSFEYRDDKPTTDNGTRIDMGCNYIFVDNYVPYGAKL